MKASQPNVGWLTAFVDRPAETFEACTSFWSEVTGTTVSEARGTTGEFGTLVPPVGDAFLRVQRVDEGPGGCHLDVHTGAVERFADHAEALGASRLSGDGVIVLKSPAGFTFCSVTHRGEAERPRSVVSAAGHRTLLDQLSIDVGAAHYDEECDFWSNVLDAELHRSSVRDEFAFVTRGVGQPLRIMLQRRDDDAEPATGHLDWSCDDIDDAIAVHVAAGAIEVDRFRYWTVMRDPGGVAYCLTHRSPDWSTHPTG